MTDDADRSDEKIEAAIQEGLKRVRKQAGLFYTGECWYCGEDVPEPLRFCDAECRDDYDAERRLKLRQGG